MKLSYLMGIAAVFGFSAAQATTLPLKPGLYEIEMILTLGGKPQTFNTKTCMTKNDVNRNRFDQTIEKVRANKSCKLDLTTDAPQQVSATWECSGDEVQMHGEGQLVFDSDTQYRITTSEHTNAAGHQIDNEFSVHAKRISDCGVDDAAR